MALSCALFFVPCALCLVSGSPVLLDWDLHGDSGFYRGYTGVIQWRYMLDLVWCRDGTAVVFSMLNVLMIS